MLPVVRILVLWIIGVLLIPFINCTYDVVLGIVILASLFFIGLCSVKSYSNKYTENLLLLIIVLGIVKLLSLHSDKAIDLSPYYNQENRVLIKVKERYKTSNYYHKYIVELSAVRDDSMFLIQQDCLLMQANDSLTKAFYPGEVFWGDVYCTQIKSSKHKALFDASKYWALKGVSENLWLKNENIHFIESDLSWFYLIKRKQVEWIELLHRQQLNKSTQQIVSALVLGDRRGVSKDISTSFTNLGLIHTLALSGLHISLIYGICAFVLSILFKYRPKLQSIVLVFIILSYAILTGLSPSVMRASLMFLLYAFSLAINRRTTAFNIVFLSALILLIYNQNLLFDIGFQLSYLSVFGILYFYKFFRDFIEKQNYLKRFILSLALVSLSAQVSVGLLSVYYFHSFPISFLWANIIILPFITILLYSSVAYLFFIVLGFQFQFMDGLMDALIGALLYVLSIIEHYSFLPIEVYISQAELYYYYGLIILVCWVFLEKQLKWIYFFYAYVLTGVFGFSYFIETPIKELFVNASKHGLVISISANNEQVIITDDTESIHYLLGDYALRNSIDCVDTIALDGEFQNSYYKLENKLQQCFDKKLLVLCDENIDVDKRLTIDILLMRVYRLDVARIEHVFSPKNVLIDARLSIKQKRDLVDKWKKLGVVAFDLRDSVYVVKY